MKNKLFLFFCINLFFSYGQNLEVPAFAKKVYSDICETMGNGKVLMPSLVLSVNPKEVASFFPNGMNGNGKSEVAIGVKFVQLVRGFGVDSSNAMAHVLGHELAHIILGQNKELMHLGSGYASPEFNKQLKKYKYTLRDSIFERQADEYSAFYAHMSGYNTVDISSRLLDSIYVKFELKESQMTKYPPLKERKLIAATSGKQMNVLKKMFDAANIATIAGNYQMAIAFYETIINERFPSKEIHNNLGLAYLLLAYKEIDTLDFPYKFPFEIDLESKLYSNTRSLSNESEAFLLEAIKQFKFATQIDENYNTAWLNRAICEFLLNNEDFDISILRASRSSENNIKIHAELLKILHEHKYGDAKKAMSSLESIQSKDELAKVNFQILNPKTTIKQDKQNLNLDFSVEIKKIVSLSDPKFDFISQEAKKSDTLSKIMPSLRSFRFKVLENEFFYGEQWVNQKGTVYPTINIYKIKNTPILSKEDLLKLKNEKDVIFFLKKKTYILKGRILFILDSNNQLEQCLYIK
jgi:hypothetical protein